MTKEYDCGVTPRSRRLSRREFIIQLAALAGLLAACDLAEPPATPTSAPSPTPVPTAPPPTVAPAAAGPTATPTLRPVPPRPAIIKFHPDAPSRVVHTRHAGVWDGDTLVPGALRQMLDASITKLTGLNDAKAAWAALFDPGERIAIKVNAFRNSIIWTHVPLVLAVTECLQEAGIPAEQIVVFDYYTSELKTAGFSVNQDGPGVRCYGTDRNYTAGWKVVGTSVRLSDVLLGCDALINMPILKSHMLSGLSFAMKNHYGTMDRPSSLHSGERLDRGMAELNALPPIKDRTRLIVGDALAACLRYASSYPYWSADMVGDSLFMSFDPVAHDTVGLEVFSQLLTADEGNPAGAIEMASPWLKNGAKLGLGTNDPDHMELAEIKLT